MLSFGVVLGLVAILGHSYLYFGIVRHLVPSRGLRVACSIALAAIVVVIFARRTLTRELPPFVGDAIGVGLYTWMGLALCVVLALAVLDVTKLVLRFARPRNKDVDFERRALIARAVAGSALVTGVTTASYGSWRAFSAPEITELSLKIAKWPRALDGLSIVQISDLHVGAFIQRRFMDELVARVNALKPDLVAITGDLVDGSVERLGPHVAALSNLRARFGSFFVTGNHDYGSGDDAWCAFLRTQNIGVLRNEGVSIGDRGGSFELFGVDDWSGGRRRGKPGYDLDKALTQRNPDKASVLLAHQPANFVVAANAGVDLQLSGHTHGGQMFPMTHLIGLKWDHTAGHYQHDDAHIFVSRGCGFWGPPMRVGSPPEIARLVITS